MAADGPYDRELQNMHEDLETKTKKEKDLQQILQSDIRRYKRVGVGVGLLCAVLALLNIAVPLSLNRSNMVKTLQLQTSFDQSEARYKLLTEERDQLQISNSNLTEERDQLQISNSNLTEERDQLQISNSNLTEERDQLQISNSNLTEERDQLQISNSNLTEERDQLQISNSNLTNERDDKRRMLCESPGWKTFDRGLYYISKGKKNWTESRQYCRARQSDLIVIKGKEEQDFVKSFNKRVWLGLTDMEVEGSFQWVDGTPLSTPTYWTRGNPDNSGGENCVEYYDGSDAGAREKGWNDNFCHFTNNWICEKNMC